MPPEICECCGGETLVTNTQGVCPRCANQLSELWNWVVMDAMLITHKDYSATEEFLKDYCKNAWRNE